MVQWCHLGILLVLRVCEKEKILSTNFFSFLTICHFICEETHKTCGLKLIPPELLEDLVINPCPVSTSQSSFITIPVCCGSSYLGRVFFSSGRNTLHIVRWSTSLRCACTQIYIVQCPPPNATLSCDTQLAGSRSYLGKWVLCLGRVPCVVTWAFGLSPVFSSIQYSAVFPQVLTAR